MLIPKYRDRLPNRISAHPASQISSEPRISTVLTIHISGTVLINSIRGFLCCVPKKDLQRGKKYGRFLSPAANCSIMLQILLHGFTV